MDDARLVKISKYLSKHLRHQPERLGLTLARGGWVEVDALLAACRARQFPLTLAELQTVVARSDKQRFSFDADGRRLRANQGHSVEVDLELAPAVPPDVLYHGTGITSVPAILASGLQRMQRHHVHLSADIETAHAVGQRHGRPSVFTVDAKRMWEAGHPFFRTQNGVWLVAQVPPEFLRQLY